MSSSSAHVSRLISSDSDWEGLAIGSEEVYHLVNDRGGGKHVAIDDVLCSWCNSIERRLEVVGIEELGAQN